MDKAEAYKILCDHLNEYREMRYSLLVEKVNANESFDVAGSSGSKYQLEFHFVWDDKANGNIRVIGSIDDTNWYAFHPLSDDFIVAADGTFVGEDVETP